MSAQETLYFAESELCYTEFTAASEDEAIAAAEEMAQIYGQTIRLYGGKSSAWGGRLIETVLSGRGF